MDKVGIGSSTVTYQLDVNKSAGATWLTQFKNATNNSRFLFGHGNGYGAYISCGTNAASSTYALKIQKEGVTPYLFIRGDGPIGIGTETPNRNFEIRTFFNSPDNPLLEPTIRLLRENDYSGYYFDAWDIINSASNLNFNYGHSTSSSDPSTSSKFTFSSTGNFTATGNIETAGLHINGNINSHSLEMTGGIKMDSDKGITLSRSSWGNYAVGMTISSNGGGQGLRYSIWENSSYLYDILFLGVNGRVGIGTGQPESALTVKGEIVCSKLRVKDIAEIPDYVFKTGYKLRSIEEVEAYINTNKHLPGVPSEQEIINSNGIDIAEMNMILF